MNVLKIFKLILLCSLVGFLACTEGEEDESSEPTASPTPIQIIPIDPGPSNPDCAGVLPFSEGTLWKPESERDGNLVFLGSPKFIKKFDSCSVLTRGGQSEALTFFYFANGGRQHWRGNQPGGNYADNGGVVCVEPRQVCIFKFVGSSSDRHE